jgi:hypothetical protein
MATSKKVKKNISKVKNNNDKNTNSKGKNAVDTELLTIANYYDLSSENLTASLILHKMSENLELYLKIIQQILQPEEFHSLHECVVFDDLEKSKLFELYGRIIIAHREIIKSAVINDEREYFSTIKYIHSEILAVRPMMLEIVKKMQSSWNIDRKDLKRKPAQYFG